MYFSHGASKAISEATTGEVAHGVALAVLWIDDPGLEAVTLQSRVLLVHLLSALQIIRDAVVPQRIARQPTRFASAAPIQLADLENPMVPAMGIVGSRVEP